MKFKLGLAQVRHRADGDAIALAESVMVSAATQGVQLLVFPESFMSRYEADRAQFLAESEPIGGPFTQTMDALAARYGLWVVYTMNEARLEGSLPFNTAIVVDSQGVRRGVYRKVHLFDSSTTHESERMSAGDTLLAPIETPFCKLGVAICYDLRFPEVARSAALQGCELMVFPSAWVDGRGKARQWQTLLRARAIENEMFVAGVSRVDEGYVGRSCVFAPDGRALAQAGTETGLVCARIDMDKLARMREAIPVFDHRRPELYRKWGHDGNSCCNARRY